MPAPLSPERRESLEQDLRERGGQPSIRDYARKHSVSTRTVFNYAKRLGIDFGDEKRLRMEKATKATRATAKQRLSELSLELVDEAYLLKSKLHQEWVAYNFGGRDNTYAQHVFEEPDAATQKTIITSMAILIDKVATIEKLSSSGGEHAASQFASWLATLVEPVGEYDPAAIA